MTAGICRLCGVAGPVEDSHLIPNAIVKRFYRTSPTGGARSVGVPNRRAQSFLHKPLLCRRCEERFAAREDRWMKDVDHRIDERPIWSFKCIEAHRYFAASLAWRTLVWEMPERPDAGFTAADRARMDAAERDLRAYLLDAAPYPDPAWPWPHILRPPDGFTGGPPGLNVYLRGCLDATVEATDEGMYAITALGGYLVVSVLTIDPNPFITWTLGTELRPGSKVHVDPRRFPEDYNFRRLIANRAAAVADSHDAMSEKQVAEVKRRVDAVLDPTLRTNPHVIATLTDRFNRG